MKTNLDTLFKMDKGLETEGIWLEFGSAKFKVKRFGGSNTQSLKASVAKHYKPYARLIEMGTLDADREREIVVKVFVEASLVGWEGVEIDGKEVPFSKEKAIELFMELPDLFDAVQKYASDKESYREELGNS